MLISQRVTQPHIILGPITLLVLWIWSGACVRLDGAETCPLLRLAKQNFGKELSPAEAKLMECVAAGDLADFSAASEEENDPEHSEEWNAERTLQGSRLEWLLTDSRALALIPPRGLTIKGCTN